MGDLPLGELLMGSFGGLALFLFGMGLMTDALRAVAGAGMSRGLARLTSNRFAAATTGAFVTAVIQSSSVTTVLVVGFVSAGIMTLPQSVGVIMGANIGTTVTAQIIAFRITEYALAIVAVGFALTFVTKRPGWRNAGSIILGLGLIFLGMGIMSEATESLRTHEPFIDLMRRMTNPFLAILVAAGFTAIVQSSSATTGIVIVLAAQGFITLEAGIALAMGANIGTCVTAGLAALGKPAEARQAALVHLLFNVLGVAIWLPLIGWLAGVVVSVSPGSPGLDGAARLAAETPRQIANAHTIFNVANTLVFIWFTAPMAWIVRRLAPARPEPVPEAARPKFLQEVYLETPALALDAVRREIVRLGEHTSRLVDEAGAAMLSGSERNLQSVVRRSQDAERLYDTINDYLRRMSARTSDEGEIRRSASLTAIASQVQNVAETAAVNMVALGRERLAARVSFSPDTVRRIRMIADLVRESLDHAIASLDDPAAAPGVIEMKPRVQAEVAELMQHLFRRLTSSDPHRAVVYRLESQIVELTRRIHDFARKIAKEVIAAEASSSAATPEP
jgi:phosphate:Na+ symporter